MAEALMRAKLSPACAITVASAGTAGDGTPPPPEAVRVMASVGLDIEGRPSRPVDADDLRQADLVVTMGRQHLIDVATTYPPVLERAFTFADLLDRASRAGARGPSETVAQWARRMSAGRERNSILTLPASDDIADPIGRPLKEYEDCFAILDRATTQLASHLCPGVRRLPAAGPRPGTGRRGLLARLGLSRP